MKPSPIQLPAPLAEGRERLLLHACCAPCSSAIVEWLTAHGVQPTIYYYNPNIWPREEYDIRKQESQRHAAGLGLTWVDGDYDHQRWLGAVSGLEQEPERGRRCDCCFAHRLRAAAEEARRQGIRYFATTLASSRWKNIDQVNHAGLLAQQAVGGTEFWPQNWRKGGLQQRRGELLRQYGFYNQQYCGCEFSARQASPTKAVLRQLMREAGQRHALLRPRLSAETAARLEARLAATTGPVVAYWPLPDEVDLRPLLQRLAAQGRTVLLPRVTGDTTMTLHRFTTTADLSEGAFHIMEPTGPPFADDALAGGVALVPGMAFDAAGHRLGRGRGYYDRFLAAHPALLKIGVAFPYQRVAEVPAEPHDAVMDEMA